MKILVLNPFYGEGYSFIQRNASKKMSRTNFYPIHLAYLVGYLEKHGYDCRLFDAEVKETPIKEVIKLVVDEDIDFLIVWIDNNHYKQFNYNFKKTKIIFVGAYCNFDTEEKSKFCDHIVVGEFDKSVLDIIEGRESNKIVGGVPESLDNFPFVTQVYKKHLDIKDYYAAFIEYPYVDILTSRKCIWGLCNFCLWENTLYKNSVRRERDIGDVVDEFRYVRKHLPNVREIFIEDEEFQDERAEEFAEKLIKTGVNIRWGCLQRVNNHTDFGLLYKSGCRTINVGFESADNSILRKIRKGSTVEMAESLCERASKAGLNIHGAFIIAASEFEDESTIRKTIEWAKRMPITSYQFYLTFVEEGTPLYDELKAKGYLKGNIPNYPHLNSERICELYNKTYRTVYFNPYYAWKILKKPGEWTRIIKAAYYFGIPLVKRSFFS